MNFIAILLQISPALEAGTTLKSAKGWGNVATASHSLVVVFGFLLLALKAFNIDIPLSDTQLATLAGAIASVGGTVATWAGVSSSPHRGIVRK